MKIFPKQLNVNNKEAFNILFYQRMKCYLRRDIYEHIISHEETDYFSLDNFNNRVNNIELVKKMTSEIILELEDIGWKCKTSYGGTALFIYSGDKPVNCLDGDL
jgi:hypothetical protein